MDMIATTFDMAGSFRAVETAFSGIARQTTKQLSVVGDLSGA
jgi:hypothetical protein